MYLPITRVILSVRILAFPILPAVEHRRRERFADGFRLFERFDPMSVLIQHSSESSRDIRCEEELDAFAKSFDSSQPALSAQAGICRNFSIF